MAIVNKVTCTAYIMIIVVNKSCKTPLTRRKKKHFSRHCTSQTAVILKIPFIICTLNYKLFCKKKIHDNKEVLANTITNISRIFNAF